MSEEPRPGEERKESILDRRKRINDAHAQRGAGGESSREVEEMRLVGSGELQIKVGGEWLVLTVSTVVSIPPQQIVVPRGFAGATITIPSSTAKARVAYYFAPVSARRRQG